MRRAVEASFCESSSRCVEVREVRQASAQRMLQCASFVALLAVSAALRPGLSQCTACPHDTETAFEARAGSGEAGKRAGEAVWT